MCKQSFVGAIGCSIGLLLCAPNSFASSYEQHMQIIPSVKSSIAHKQLLTDVTVNGDTAIAVGAYGHILISEDNGMSWVQANVPVNVLLTAVDFPTPDKGWAVGHEGVILHSDDGGKNWVLQWANPLRQISEEEYDQMSDEDFGKIPQMGAPLLDVWFKNANEGYAVGAYGMFMCTEDSGKNWNDCSSMIENYDGWHLNAVGSNNAGVMYIVGEKGTLFRSDNRGENWITLTSPYQGSFFNFVTPDRSDEIVLFGLGGNTFRSEDRGDTWTKITHKARASIMAGVQFNSHGMILVGNAGNILTSHDDGKTFNLQSTEDREDIVGVAKLSNGKLIFVGQGGVTLASPNTK